MQYYIHTFPVLFLGDNKFIFYLFSLDLQFIFNFLSICLGFLIKHCTFKSNEIPSASAVMQCMKLSRAHNDAVTALSCISL